VPYSELRVWDIQREVVQKKKRPNIPLNTPSDYKKLMQACWQDESNKSTTNFTE
jgi:hypothetical protein